MDFEVWVVLLSFVVRFSTLGAFCQHNKNLQINGMCILARKSNAENSKNFFIEHQILTSLAIYVYNLLLHIKVRLHNFIEKSDIHSYTHYHKL